MGDNRFDDEHDLDVQQASPAAPAGLQQAARSQQGYESGDNRFADDYIGQQTSQYGYAANSSAWLSGANREGTANGWDNELVQNFIPQWNQALQEGRGAEFFNDAEGHLVTGIVTWDHSTTDGVSHKFGDIYTKGELTGNIYDQFDRDTANLVMGEFLFDADRKQAINGDGDPSARLEAEISSEREQRNTSFAEGQQALAFQSDVDAKANEFREGWVDEGLAALAAAGTGAASAGAAGTVVGPVGTVVAGIGGAFVGGFAAWANRDSLTEQAARAYEITGLATETEGRIAGILTGVNQWSGIAGKSMVPLSNIVQGYDDATRGRGGDGVSEFYSTDEFGQRTASKFIRGLDVVASVGDAFLQFASPVGLAAYSAQMSGTILGEVGQMAVTDGKSFDYSSGSFDNVFTDEEGNFDLSSAAAGVGKVGIDVVQLGFARGLAGSTNAAREAVGGTRAYGIGSLSSKMAETRALASESVPLWLGGTKGLAAGESRVREAGFSFTRTAEGSIKSGSMRPTLGILAPSEQLGALSARVLGRRAAQREGGAYTADDFYHAAHNLANNSRKINTVLVNAMGEGYEEGVQSILEAHSHGNRLDWAEIGNSALYGFTAGAGMGFGMVAKQPSADDRLFADFQLNELMLTGQATTDRATFDKMTTSQKAAGAKMSKAQQATVKAAYAKVVDDMAFEATAGVAGTAKLLDSIQSQLSQALAQGNDRVNGAYVITQIQTAEVDKDGNLLPGAMPSDAAAASALQIGRMHANHMKGINGQIASLNRDITELEQRLGDPEDPLAAEIGTQIADAKALLGQAELTFKWGQAFEDVLAAHIDAMLAPGLTTEEIDAEVAVLNRKLRDAFNLKIDSLDGELLTPADRMALAKAVTALVARDPHDQAGSYQLLVPQVSAALTAANANDVVQVSHAILSAISGDYDGDKVRPLNELILSDEAFTAGRSGQFFLGAGTSVNIGTPKWESHNILAMARAMEHEDALGVVATEALTSIGAAIRKRYDGVVDGTVLDGIFARFNDAIRAGDKDARKFLLDGLAAEAGGPLNEFSRNGLTNEWLWIDQLVVSTMQKFQGAYASNRSNFEVLPDTTIAQAHSRTPSDLVSERKLARAATQGQSLGLLLEGDSMFRKSQKLHYSLLSAKVIEAAELDNTSELYKLAQMYAELGRNLTTTELAAAGAKDEITARVFAQLQRLSLQAQEMHPQLNKLEMLSLISNIQVVDLDMRPDGRVKVNRNDKGGAQMISLGQLLLKRSVEQDQVDKRQILGASPELQAKHARLLAMTKPGSTKKNPVNAERAFVEIVGSQQMYTLLGDDSGLFGPHLTVEQYVRYYTAMPESRRAEEARRLKGDPSYGERKGLKDMPYRLEDMVERKVSAYKSMVDAVIAVGNYRISYDPATGKINGELAKRSESVSIEFTEAHAEIRRAIADFERLEPRKDGETEVQMVQRLLESNPDFARAVMDLIPGAAANGVFFYDEQRDDVLVANWVHKLLTITDAKAAEMHYWRNVLLAEWNSLGMRQTSHEDGEDGETARRFDRLPRRMHRIMYNLNPEVQKDGGLQMRRFISELENATDLDEFISWVNGPAGIRGDQAPIVPWVDDVAEFDQDKANGGWTTALQGTELREAITFLRRATTNLVKDLAEERAAGKADTRTILAIRRALRDGANAAPNDKALLDKFAKSMVEASDRGLSFGPQAMIYQTIGAVTGFYPYAHTKGVSPEHVEPNGAFDALRDAYDYTTNYERVLASLTAVNLQAVGGNMGELARDGVRTMDEDGHPVTWEMPRGADNMPTDETISRMLDLLEDGGTRPLARSVLFPQVMERGADGQLRPQLLVGKSLTSLLNSVSHRDVFPKNDSLSRDSAMRYVAMVEMKARAKGGHFSVQRAVNDIVIARTSAADHQLTVSEIEQMTIDAYYEAAQLLQAAGSIAYQPSGPDFDPLGKALESTKMAQRIRRTAAALNIVKAENLEWADLQIEVFVDAQEAEVNAAIAAAQETLTPASTPAEIAEVTEAVEAMKADLEAYTKRAELLLADDMTGQVVDMFLIPKGQADTMSATKDQLVDFVLTRLGDAKLSRSVLPLVQQITQAHLDPNQAGHDPLTAAQWEQLSRAVIGVYLDDVVSRGSVSVSPFPDADHAADHRYFDTTFAYLAEPFLDGTSPLVQAAAEIHGIAGRGAEMISDEDLVRLLDRTLFKDFSYGAWTSDIPRASIEAGERLLSAAAAQSIAMVGNSPKRQAVISAATRRTFEKPSDALLAKTSLSWDYLNWSDFDDIPVLLPGQTEAVMRPLAQLNNRFAKSARIRFVDNEGVEQDLDLFQVPDTGRLWLSEPSVAASGYQEVHTKRLISAASKVAAKYKIDPATVTVDLEFFHPDSQPTTVAGGPNWMNNIYFEGTSFGLDGDRHGSLNETLWFANDSINPQGGRNALDASKLGKPALQVVPTVKATEVADIEAGWMGDLAAVLRAKTRKLFEMDLGGVELEADQFYNAVYKNLKLRHFVRGTGADGNPVLLTADRAIELQATGKPLPEDAELWIPTDDVLRSMLGEQGTQGVPARMFGDPLDVDLSRVPTFTGDTTRAIDMFAGTAVGRVTELKNTTIANRARQQQLVVRAMIDQKTRDRYEATRLYFDKLASEIHTERSDGGFSPDRNLLQAVSVGKQFLSSENISFDWGTVGLPFGPRDTDALLASELLLGDLQAALTADSYRTGWIYEEGGAGNLADGRLTKTNIGSGTGGHRVAPGDLVVLQLDSFGGDAKKAKKRLDYFVDHGAIVVLAASNSDVYLRAELADYLEGNDYGRIAGSGHIYQPLTRTSRYQNQRARSSTLTETRNVSPKNYVAIFNTQGLGIQENAGWTRPDDRRLKSIAVSMNLVPSAAFVDFNVPVTPEQIANTRAQILGDDNGEMMKSFLREQSNQHLTAQEREQADLEFDKAFDRMIQRFNTHDGVVLPQRGDTFGTGDMIPLVSGQNGILLYRHGHQAPRDRFDVNSMLNVLHPSGSGRAANVAVYTPKRAPAATTHEGTVVEFNPRSAYGMSVELQVDLQQFGDKVQLEWNGMKYVLAPKPDSIHLPDHELMDGWDISIVADADSSFAKESYEGLVDNHRNAFAYLGIDFTGDVAEFFFPGRGGTPQARRDSQAILKKLSFLINDVSVESADELVKYRALASQFRALLPAFASDNASTVDPSWVTRLGSSSVEAQITTAMILYLATPGAKLEHVLRSGGFNDTDTDPDKVSTLMPRLFTQAFDYAPLNSPLRVEMNRRLNSQLTNPRGDNTGYILHQDFTLEVRNADPTKTMFGWLQFAEAHSSGDNPILNGMAFDEDSRQQVSTHSSMTAFQAIGARTAMKYDIEKAKQFVNGDGITRFGVRQGREDGGVWSMLTTIGTNDKSAAAAWRALGPAEIARRENASDMVGQFRKPINIDPELGWDDATGEKYRNLVRSITAELGLRGKQKELVDFWVRQTLGQPAGRDAAGKALDRITANGAIEAATDILWNVQNRYSPVASAMVPLLHIHDLQAIYRANQTRSETQRWEPRTSVVGPKTTAHKWNEWVEVSLGTALTSDDLFDPLFLLALDGHMHSYQNATRDLLDLPVSMDSETSLLLMDPQTNQMLVSLDLHTEALAKDPVLFDTARANIDQLIGGNRIAGGSQAQRPAASEITKRRAAIRKWRQENGMPFPVDETIKDLRKNGKTFAHHSTTTNALARMLINLRVGTALFNPALYVSMGPEQWVRGSLDRLANVLTGQSTTGATARMQAGLTVRFADAAQKRKEEFMARPKSGEGFMALLYEDLLKVGIAGAEAPESLGLTSRFTPEQLVKFNRLWEELGKRNDFKAMVYRDLMFLRPHEPGIRRMEKWLEGYAALGSRMQDPTWGMKGDTMARRYGEAALQVLMSTGEMTADQFISEMSSNPTFLRDHHPDAHQMASNSLAQIRSLKATPLSLALRGIYEPMSESSNGAVNFFGNVVLKLPLLFSGYAMNVATTILGMQGLSDMTAMFLEGRENYIKDPKTLLGRVQAKLRGEEFTPENVRTFDMSSVHEGFDLSRSFIRGGLTHTGLFVTAMMAGGLGLSGEDDESKKRRLMAKKQRVGHIYDPRDIQNDFRNADAMYLDWLPYGSEASGAVTMVQPHWMLKQFISPIMGIEKFFETGDHRQITWGFQDAISSFPLINTLYWNDAVETAQQLADMADAEAKAGGSTDLISAGGLLTKVVANYERMLFENAWANSIYVALDKYDRDPYALTLKDSDGELQVDIEGNARKNNLALQSFPQVGEDGKVTIGQGYLGRDDTDAYLHSLTENRFTLAAVMSVFSGLGPGEADYFRQSQPIKTRTFEKPIMDQSEAEEIILGGYLRGEGVAQAGLTRMEAESVVKDEYKRAGVYIDYSSQEFKARVGQKLAEAPMGAMSIIAPDGHEKLTKEGAKAVILGLVKRTVDFTSPTLDGIYIPTEMRNEIIADWSKELIQEGIDLGLNETAAFFRMKRLIGGPSEDPTKPGLSDYVYSQEISYKPNRVYNQLNTTYTVGPDGKPVATGFKRDSVLASFGLQPVTRYLIPQQEAMALDSRGNSVDLINGVNTGLRGLELVDDSRNIPTDKEIGDAIIEAIKKAGQQQYSPSDPYKSSGGGSYKRGGGYGGGYSGGGYANFRNMYELPHVYTPYSNSISQINTSDPILRRASVRRERVWSERGRLNQWQ